MDKNDYINLSRAELIKEIILLNNEKDDLKEEHVEDLSKHRRAWIRKGVPNAITVCEDMLKDYPWYAFIAFDYEAMAIRKSLKIVIKKLKENK